MARRSSARWPFVACVLLQTVIFGSGSAITKLAYESITPLWCLVVRFGLAALVFGLFLGPRIVRQLRSVRVRDWLPAALCMALSFITCNVALDLTTATNVGFLVALAACRVRLVRDFVDPIMSLLRTIPVVSFIIMLLIWVGNQALTVFLAFFIVLPIIYTNMVTGFESVDRQMLEMARVYGLSRWRTFLYVYRPAFMPFLMSSAKLSLGMSWKSGIMAEVLATPKPSIGKEMSTARTFLDTPDLFAWTVVVMVLSAVFEKLFMEVLKLANRPLGGLIGKKGRGDE